MSNPAARFLCASCADDLDARDSSSRFGLRHGVRYQRLEKVLGRMLDRLGSPFSVSFLFFPVLQLDFGPLSPWGSFVRDRQEINHLIFEEIAERRAHPNMSWNDILSLLTGARDEEGEALTDSELRDELMTLLTAGHETTATALTWALYWIHKLPSVRQQLLSELQSFLPEASTNSTGEKELAPAIVTDKQFSQDRSGRD